jgi:hypothetical protein
VLCGRRHAKKGGSQARRYEQPSVTCEQYSAMAVYSGSGWGRRCANRGFRRSSKMRSLPQFGQLPSLLYALLIDRQRRGGVAEYNS